jgi:FAS-associated factor 2
MADNNDMDRKKLAYFQEITGVKDASLSHQILDAYGWDLDSAIQAMVDKNTNAIPEYEESMRDSNDNSVPPLQPDTGVEAEVDGLESGGRASSPVHSPADVVVAGAGAGGAAPMEADDRSLFERIGDGPAPSGASAVPAAPLVTHASDGSTFVWRIVTLPFILLRGSYNLLYGAMGLGVWMAGGVLSLGLGALRLTGSSNQGVGGVEIGSHQAHMIPGGGLIPSGASEANNFLRAYERRYGEYHPEFQAVSFMEALRRAGQEFKFLFVYLHATQHVSTPAFCETTLRNDVVVDFINANYIAWGADVHKTEGYQMSNSLNASTFPFCAIIAGSSSQRIAVVRQVEGYKSAEELLDILQSVVEEQSASLIAGRQEQEARDLNCRLREEQDEAYRIGLLQDQERDRREQALADQAARERFDLDQKKIQDEKEAAQVAQILAAKQGNLARQRHEKFLRIGPEPERGPDVTHVAVRLPSGERKERRFRSTATVQMLYDYVDTLEEMGAESHFLLISNFPRVEYGPDKVDLTLMQAGLHPRTSLLIQMHES